MPSVLITGANRGLGLEFARQYAADGWVVVGCCRRPAEAQALKALGVEVHALDVAVPEQAEALACGPLAGRSFDLLLNNAGIYGTNQSFGGIDAQGWSQVLQTNTIGPVKMAEAFLPHVERSEKKVMAFLSSVMGSIAGYNSGGATAYRSSKAALNAAVTGLAVDLAGRVTLLLLHPGWVRTDMGGAGAAITPEVSVTGLRKVIASASPRISGSFFDYRGTAVPW